MNHQIFGFYVLKYNIVESYCGLLYQEPLMLQFGYFLSLVAFLGVIEVSFLKVVKIYIDSLNFITISLLLPCWFPRLGWLCYFPSQHGWINDYVYLCRSLARNTTVNISMLTLVYLLSIYGVEQNIRHGFVMGLLKTWASTTNTSRSSFLTSIPNAT